MSCKTRAVEIHAACRSLAFLLGVWRGAGHGHYPTIESFDYTEEVTFSHVGKPFLGYSQKTRHATTGAPLHAETGYLRAVGGEAVEFVVVQPSGILEVHTGIRVGTRLQLEPHTVLGTPSAKDVTSVRREMRVESDGDGDRLVYDVSMAAVGEPLTHHLRAELLRD